MLLFQYGTMRFHTKHPDFIQEYKEEPSVKMSKDPDYIVRVEQAIADKYGEEAIQNPKAEWDENKEKVYLEQMRDLYKKQKKNDAANDKVELNGIKVSRKLLNRESKTGCPVCGAFSHSPEMMYH